MLVRMRFVLLVVAAIVVGHPRPASCAGPADQPEKKPAAKVTYDDHVRPILRQNCFTCHNQNQAKGGLAMDSYARLMEGGSSGEVVFEEDPDSSRLWSLVSHDEEPHMPPNQDKLPDKSLAVIRQWIEDGLLERSGSKSKAKKPALNLAIQATSGKPEGPVAMPAGVSCEPVVTTQRAGAITGLASSPWAPLVAVAGQQQICLYHSDSGKLLGILPFPNGIPYCLRFSHDGALLLAAGGHAGAEGWAALYDVKTGQLLTRVGDELDAVLDADLNPEHTRIALGSSARMIRVFSTETTEQLQQIKKHTDWIYAVRFSPDGVLMATGDRTSGLFVWEADTGREYLNLRGHAGGVTDVAWRFDSNVLASASLDGTVRLWEMNDGKQIKRINAHAGGVLAVAFSHDGRLVTAGQDRRVKLWDANGKALKTFPAFPEPALQAVFTYDGKRVVAGDWSGQVRVWNVADGKEVLRLPPNPPRPNAANHNERPRGPKLDARSTDGHP